MNRTSNAFPRVALALALLWGGADTVGSASHSVSALEAQLKAYSARIPREGDPSDDHSFEFPVGRKMTATCDAAQKQTPRSPEVLSVCLKYLIPNAMRYDVIGYGTHLNSSSPYIQRLLRDIKTLVGQGEGGRIAAKRHYAALCKLTGIVYTQPPAPPRAGSRGRQPPELAQIDLRRK